VPRSASAAAAARAITRFAASFSLAQRLRSAGVQQLRECDRTSVCFSPERILVGPLQDLSDDLTATPADAHPDRHRLPPLLWLINLIVIIFPFAGLVLAIALLWGWGFSWVHLGLLLGMYLVSGFGITIGYHRLFTHKSFETNRWVKLTLGIFGSMAFEGPLLKWVAHHRKHHQHSDQHDDPHSPHLHGHGWLGMLRGLWHAHLGWIFIPDAPNLTRYIPDLSADRLLRAVSATFTIWAALGLLIPALLGGLLTMSWTGALLGFIWGGLARIFFVHHVTWSINSVCHMWGSRPFRSHDESRNNLIFGLLGLGEGWHNNHHAFPRSARHGLSWWQVDLSWYIIALMQRLGLAWNVRVPAAQMMEMKRAQ
jgi:stearoyl-CoA desaturase (delta-9 desaturase)